MTFVSVIIPAYNRIDELIIAINSVLNQSYKNLEIIIVDDCSTIDIKTSIFKINSDKIKYFKMNQNRGVTESRKLGIEKANGDLISFLDDDDSISQNCIEDKVKMFKSDSDINLVMSNYIENNLINNSQTIHRMVKFSNNFAIEICKRPGPFFQCCMFKRELLNNYESLFDKESIPSEDWDFFLNLSQLKLNIGFINQQDFTWNFSPNSQSANFKNEASGLGYILKKHQQLFLQRVGNSRLSDHYRMVARVYEKDYNFNKAKENYKKAFNINPINYKNVFYKFLSHFSNSNFRFILNIMRNLRGTP